MTRHVVIRVGDEQVPIRSLIVRPCSDLHPTLHDVNRDFAVPVPQDDQLTRAIGLACDALGEAAGNRYSEDEKFDISRADAAENEQVADEYMVVEQYLRAAFNLDEEE